MSLARVPDAAVFRTKLRLSNHTDETNVSCLRARRAFACAGRTQSTERGSPHPVLKYQRAHNLQSLARRSRKKLKADADFPMKFAATITDSIGA